MSPAATMTTDEARAAVLAAANELFYARGIAGVAMSDVRDRSGVSMRRLYVLYPSKGDLVAGWLEDRHLTWTNWFTAAVERHIECGTDSILAVFDTLDEWTASPGYRGCAFINAIAETGEIDQRHRAIVAAHKRSLTRDLALLAARDHPRAPDWLPTALGVLLDGTIVQCAVYGTAEPITAARRAARELLETVPT